MKAEAIAKQRMAAQGLAVDDSPISSEEEDEAVNIEKPSSENYKMLIHHSKDPSLVSFDSKNTRLAF